MKSHLLKYKIGLAVIALFTLGIVGFVVMQASATKQDTKTNSAANDIANKLNAYITDNQTVPTSLAQAGVKNAPATITYQKLSEDSYKFCATYKANSSGFDAASAVAEVASGGTADTGSSTFTDTSSLFIDTTYHKGTDCQTIKPLIAQTQPAQCSSATSTSICLPGNPSSTLTSPSTAATSLCGYDSKSRKGCLIRCIKSTESTALNSTDDTITTITTVGGTTMMNATDTKGVKHTVTIEPSAKLYNSSCDTVSVAALLVGDQVRVIVAGQDVPAVQGAKVAASEIDDFSL